MHLDLVHARSLTGFAASATHVEGEAACVVAPHFGGGQLAVELADGIEELDVGAGIGTRSAADGILVDADHLVDVLQTFDGSHFAHLVGAAVKVVLQMGMQGLVDQ